MDLSLRNLGKAFGERVVFDGANVDLAGVRALVLIGPSGGGKSTLLRLLGGLVSPDTGSVLLDGQPLPFGDEEALRRHRKSTGFVFQAHNLFPHLTALENIVLPLEKVQGLDPATARAQALEWLGRFRLDSHARQRPFELSGGQRQRVAIARAAALKPRLLLFDEPTSSLDPEMTAEVLDMIADLRTAGRDFVLATHQMGFARRVADHVAFVGHGGVPAHGSSETMLERPTDPVVTGFLQRVLGY